MLYIIGLGNPEAQYHDTPHNIGYQLIDELVKSASYTCSPLVHNGKAMISTGSIAGMQVIMAKPTTYMNNSGEILRQFDQATPDQVVVVYDDIDLPFGQIKLSRNRGDGGHNGVKSIEQHLGSRDFIRIRVGVCPTDWFGKPRKPRGREAVENYLVRRKLSKRFTQQYAELGTKVGSILESLVEHGYEKTVSQQQR